MMQCPNCGHITTKHGIRKSEQSKALNAIRRQRWCTKCRTNFVTYEVIVDEEKLIGEIEWERVLSEG